MIIVLFGIKIWTYVVVKLHSITFIRSRCQMISITIDCSYNIEVCVNFKKKI